MKSIVGCFFAFITILQSCVLVQAAGPVARPHLNEIDDPLTLRVYQSPIQMVFSGFSKPYVHFQQFELFNLAHKAQYELVKRVAQNHGDGPIVQPNFEWCSFRICLRVNHHIDSGLTWLMLSDAIYGMIEFGWQTNFSLCKMISIVDDQAGVVAHAELVLKQS